MNAQIPVRLLLLGLLMLFLAAGCASVNASDNAEIAGSALSFDWSWSILIAVLSFVAGFLAGAVMSRSGGIQLTHHRHRHHRRNEAGWNRVRQRIQEGTRQGLAAWRSAEHTEDADWGDLSRRIEERILEEMRNHHD